MLRATQTCGDPSMAKYNLYPDELYPVWQVHPLDGDSNTEVELTDDQVRYFYRAFQQFMTVQKELVAIATAQGAQEIGTTDSTAFILEGVIRKLDNELEYEPANPD